MAFISGAGETDVLIVMARTDEYSSSQGITAFVIDAKSQGFSYGENEKKIRLEFSPNENDFL